MTFQKLDHWIILRLTYANDALWITYEDDLGIRKGFSKGFDKKEDRESPFSTDSLEQHLWPSHLPRYLIHVPYGLDYMIDSVFSSMQYQRTGPHASGPIPLAVFVEGPPEMPDHPWTAITESLPPIRIHMPRIQTLRLSRGKWAARPPFRLPLRVLSVGEKCRNALKGFQSASWYINDPEVQQYGLQFDTITPDRIARTLRAGICDVIVVEDQIYKEVLKSVGHLHNPSLMRPRLLIVLSEGIKKHYTENPSVPPGVSLLWVEDYGDDHLMRFIKEFFYGIIHNYPLHEALKSAIRDVNLPPGNDPVLFADPGSNHYLKLSDALTQLHEETLTLGQTVARGDLDAFFMKIGFDIPQGVRFLLADAFKERKPIKHAIKNILNLKLSFEHEIRSLVPLAYAEASLVPARRAMKNVKTILTPFLSNSDFVKQVEKYLDRRVDVAMEFLNPEAMVYGRIDPNRTLLKGGHYRLRVHIGRPTDESLMVGKPPPLDPLLPEPEAGAGHELEIVVFEKDFTLLSSRVRLLYLPRLSGSKPVYFELLAPEKDAAELRIGIYSKNHLLQSFILEARLGENEWAAFQGPQVTVRLNYSRTARFSNLDTLAPRALCIGVNQNSDTTTHAFMLKRNNEALPFSLTEAIVSDRLKTFRKMLQDATVDPGGNPRFPTFPDPDWKSSFEFEETIRNLADFGREIYQAIFVRSNGNMRKELRSLAGKEDDTIQIVRHDPNFAFPWSVIYDFQLPQKIAGEPPPHVCLGYASETVSDVLPAKDLTKRCSHGPKDRVYCIYGFWGMRHRIEQFMALGEGLRDAIQKVELPSRYGVCLAVGEDDEHTLKMTENLRHRLGDTMVELAPGDDLVDILWEPQKRPAILVALGHLETADIPGEPVGPRIILQARKKWLQAVSITDRQIIDGEWEQPKTLVLLMACGAAATDIATLNDLVTAFTSVGAAAIVGTECLVFSRLVARFTEEITLDLWDGVSLGDAVKNFNRRLVGSGNPLAFVFNYFGDADLKVTDQKGD